jgi:hypothetical protein
MIIIAIDSVFQLINAFNITHQKFPNDKITLIIKSNKKSLFCIDSLNKNEFVENIIFTNKRYENHMNEIFWQIESVFFPKIATKDMFDRDFINMNVTTIIASITWISLLSPIYRSFSKVKKVYLVEEGLGTYVKQEKMLFSGSKFSRIKHVLLRRQELVNNSIFWFMMPEYMKNKKNNYQKMPPFAKNIFFADSVIGFFGERQDIISFEDSKYIYFDQIFYNSQHDKKSVKAIEDQVAVIKQILLKNGNTVIKAHPRYLTGNRYNHNESTTTIPWEAISLSIDLGNKVLVSITSTSIVTPKIMLNKEPIVICLIKIFKEYITPFMTADGKKEIDNIISFFHHIKKMYNDPSRFKIPNTINELERIIEEIDSKL